MGLIGRNGTGKSSLLRIIAGLGSLDDGERQARNDLQLTLVEQEPELPAGPYAAREPARTGAVRRVAGSARAAVLGNERERWRSSRA